MEVPDSEELSALMPNLRQAAQRASSPGETAQLREYMQVRVLGERQAHLGAASTLPHKPRTDALQLRAGTARRPQRRYFTIKLRPDDPEEEQRAAAEAAAVAALDPEALKDQMLAQALAQRRALVDATRRQRPGAGRLPRPREFKIELPPLCQQEDEAAAAAAEAEAAAAAAVLAAEEAAALAEAEEQQRLLLEQQYAAEDEQWAAEEGVLAQAQQAAQVQPADATPGAGLQQHGAQPASTGTQQADSQRAQAKTPGASLYGRYTPMEGVPERLALLAATRGKAAPATVSRPGLAPLARTPAGYTPMEGVLERLHGLSGGPRGLGLPAATRVCSNEAEAASVDSPVDDWLHQGPRRGGAAPPRPADAAAAFAGFAMQSPAAEAEVQQQQQLADQATAEQQQQQQQQEQQWAEDDDDDMGGGCADDGGYEDLEVAEPSERDGGGFPLLADTGIQTGASLEREGAPMLDDGGFDAGYDAGDYGDYQQPLEEGEQEEDGQPETSAAAQQRARRQTRNPGARLRNELKRKSLAVDPSNGLREVLPGVRRSGRQKTEPLKWWLNEKKEFGREHQTMPTVRQVVHKVPNTPWQVVTDIVKRKPRRRARAPTPHDLEGALAAQGGGDDDDEQLEAEAAEDEEAQQQQQQQQWEDEPAAAEEEEQPAAAGDDEEEQQERPQRRSGRRQQAAEQEEEQQQRQHGRRQPAARGRAVAAAPGPRSKATKKQAAGGKRRGRQ